MNANEYAHLSTQARQLAATVKPPPDHPCGHALGKAAVYLHLAAVELKAVAEELASEEAGSGA